LALFGNHGDKVKQLANICTERKAVSSEYQHCVLLGLFLVLTESCFYLEPFRNFKYLRGLAALSGRAEACRRCQRCCIFHFYNQSYPYATYNW